MKIKKSSVAAALIASAVLVGCKAPNKSGSDVSSQGQQQQQAAFPSAFDLQEFYEIAKASYLKKLRTQNEDSIGPVEKAIYEKFSARTPTAMQYVDFAETMFELLESGRYEQKLHGVPRLTNVTRSAPKGLTDRDVENFYQVIKMEYFKRITKRPAPALDARESRFYERAQLKSTDATTPPADALLVASDLFDKIEGVK